MLTGLTCSFSGRVWMAQINPTLVKFPIVPQLQSGGSVDWKELELRVDGPHEVKKNFVSQFIPDY